MKEPEITEELIDKHGITPDEFEKIKEILGREPNFTELGIFSVMWSEHCSYKNSRLQLKKFPTTGDRVLVKAGEENAGVIDIGDEMAIAFKIESHNHPTAVEPFQGAATGVGGILRDIFTMGARPVALMNSLRFGDIRGEKGKTNRHLLSGAVAGIAHYGNCIGVPTVGGEVYFDSSYDGNPLVNAFCLGTLKHSEIRLGAASGVGNPVFYVGAKTGRDGLAGAAFASRDLTEESKEDRPAVQVGDPFMEKLLLEACLELFEHPEAVVGVQDMGAAGLTCSTCETASRGDTGIEIDLAKVPQRESGMTPYEVMLSESQERMLIIIKKGFEDVVENVFSKWDLDAACIGYVTDTGRCVIKNHGDVVADIPAKPLAEEAPVYERESREPEWYGKRHEFNFSEEIQESDDLGRDLLSLLGAPSLSSKRWVYRQYDHMVQTNTATFPGSDAAVIRVEAGEDKEVYLAMSLDCNGRYCSLDPYEGAKIAVAESCRNLAMTGAKPLALTDNLNYGNPHHPEIFWQLERGVDGMSEACRAFDIPVTGGNVSLYNQSPAGAIDPTPVAGVVGLIEEEAFITKTGFQQAGDVILLIGGVGSEMGGSAYLAEVHGVKKGTPPKLDLNQEVAFQKAVIEVIRGGGVLSAHDLSEGGLGVGLAECVIQGGVGAEVSLSEGDGVKRGDQLLFNESQGRALLSVKAGDVGRISDLFETAGISCQEIGKVVEGTGLAVKLQGEGFQLSIDELRNAYEGAIPEAMEG